MITDKQSCNKINRIFTCRPDPEATAEAEGGFKEEEEAEEAQAERSGGQGGRDQGCTSIRTENPPKKCVFPINQL